MAKREQHFVHHRILPVRKKTQREAGSKETVGRVVEHSHCLQYKGSPVLSEAFSKAVEQVRVKNGIAKHYVLLMVLRTISCGFLLRIDFGEQHAKAGIVGVYQ